MKESKQKIVMTALATGRYSYKDGDVYSEKWNGKIKLQGCRIPAGYIQIQVSNHRRGERLQKARVFKHVFIYMMHHGEYPEGMHIDHIDRNVSNSRIENLRCVTPKENNENRVFNTDLPGGYSEHRRIGHHEIQVIRDLHGDGVSAYAIGKILGTNRISVSRAVKKIKCGEPFKFEYLLDKSPNATTRPLTFKDVDVIRSMYNEGKTDLEVASELNIERGTAWCILSCAKKESLKHEKK